MPEDQWPCSKVRISQRTTARRAVSKVNLRLGEEIPTLTTKRPLHPQKVSHSTEHAIHLRPKNLLCRTRRLIRFLSKEYLQLFYQTSLASRQRNLIRKGYSHPPLKHSLTRLLDSKPLMSGPRNWKFSCHSSNWLRLRSILATAGLRNMCPPLKYCQYQVSVRNYAFSKTVYLCTLHYSFPNPASHFLLC